MRRFATLFYQLDATNSSLRKQDALVSYFKDSPPLDTLWCIGLFTGKRPKRVLPVSVMREWAGEVAGIEEWLVSDTYAIVGDLAETITHLIPPPDEPSSDLPSLNTLFQHEFEKLRKMDIEGKRDWIESKWRNWAYTDRFILNKLLTGGFRVGVSKGLISKALAQWLDIDPAEIANRLAGGLEISQSGFDYLVNPVADGKKVPSKPYPFYLAYPLEKDLDDIGSPNEWSAEWKWDGIRGQLIKREGDVFVWSRGEELITGSMPDISESASDLADGTVLDGELIVYDFEGDSPRSFNDMQKRIGRKKVGAKILKEYPCAFLAYDCLEFENSDIRDRGYLDRQECLRRAVAELPADSKIIRKGMIAFDRWEDLRSIWATAREHKAEGIMLKKLKSTYKEGRKKGDWWKWKTEPMSLDFVLLYARAGHGRRANLYTDYTLAAWDDDKLVPITKAYSGLRDRDMIDLDKWIKKNTVERFGPVRSVPAEQVLEIAFEGIAPSKRHKSGWALRFPRIKRWRQDKDVSEADTLTAVENLYENYS
ncbi:ATP-dependent DNA ligase [Oligoflexaceae bacterium]|nr:ATP-dependent DNA ligase [Oligoflexaceae bacterium]